MASTNPTRTSIRSQYDWSTTDPSVAIIDAIAALETVDVIDVSTALDTTLFDHVDPEALDALVTSDGTLSITFTVDRYTVQIDGTTLRVHEG